MTFLHYSVLFFLCLLIKPFRVIVSLLVGTAFNIIGVLTMFLGMFIAVVSGLIIRIGQHLCEGH